MKDMKQKALIVGESSGCYAVIQNGIKLKSLLPLGKAYDFAEKLNKKELHFW